VAKPLACNAIEGNDTKKTRENIIAGLICFSQKLYRLRNAWGGDRAESDWGVLGAVSSAAVWGRHSKFVNATHTRRGRPHVFVEGGTMAWPATASTGAKTCVFGYPLLPVGNFLRRCA